MDWKENLVLLAAALLWMVISAETSQATQLPGCQDKCGDVSIPYPFGTSEGCYFNEYFQITCNTTVTPPIPYLWSSNLQVLSISLDGHMRILTYVGTDCYSKSGASESRTGSYAVLQAFPFSNTRNKFFGIGCDTIAYISGVDIREQIYSTGCLSLCNDTGSVTNGSCNGIGCCQGYHGDGRKDGEGCSADQLPVVKIVVGVGASVIVLVAVSGLLYFGHQKRKLMKLKEKYFQQNGGLMLQQRLAGREEPTSVAKIYTAEELEKATNNFDESNIIGRGGYGIVYKGIFADNTVVAIKKSRTVDNSQIEQFINEVVVLSQINHRNVVKLLGCCLETEVPLLVYECVSNGTLSSYIHDRNKAATFTWETRLRIAAETAGVLSYLHSAASMPIIHRDVKSNNILLDKNQTAKVSDFGSSRLVPLDQAQISTMVQGTLGYLDPEYLLTSQLTEKSDVYSFGVVLVELLTGKRPLSFDGPEEERSLAMLFLSALKEDRLFQILEDCIVKEGNGEQVDKVARLVKTCLRVKGEERPTMKEVAMELERLRMVGKHPWTNVESNYEETEYLLGKKIDASGHGKSGESSSGYQVIGPVLLPSGGR
ncbi:hypothetical protein OIU77_025664 [Salix suchowensis]|uniref:Protein kinase domain-containing protein n=1 Tax=Salix suchowensis TaxID=1278906 RepID=A0ABQ9C015_9ROSI|nr:hypothetical protein OIU77_025664 [Salix suchowensis]